MATSTVESSTIRDEEEERDVVQTIRRDQEDDLVQIKEVPKEKVEVANKLKRPK